MTTQICSRFPTSADFPRHKKYRAAQDGEQMPEVKSLVILNCMNSQIFWLPWFCLICKLSWSRSCRAPFAPRRSCIVSRARLIQILTIQTLCLHRDFVSYPTQLIQILRGSQQEKLLCKRFTSKVIFAKNGDLKSSIIGFSSGWVHTLM